MKNNFLAAFLLLTFISANVFAIDENTEENFKVNADDYSVIIDQELYGSYISQRELQAFEQKCVASATPLFNRFKSYELSLGAQLGSFQTRYRILRSSGSRGSGRFGSSSSSSTLYCAAYFYNFDQNFSFSFLKTVKRTGLAKNEWKTVCGKDQSDLEQNNYIIYSSIRHHLKYYVAGSRTCLVKAVEIKKI